ncbi:MAG: glycosyltransferase [Proteobacteria bacterium]|nr:MAG: glycosyltransferase [Pseudomonadota bacterium]
MKKIILIGSNSIHCKRYIAGLVASNKFIITIITNQIMAEFSELPQYEVNFALHSLKSKAKILSIVKSFSPDIIHIHQANSYAWHSLRAMNKLKFRPKIILTAWGSDVLILPHKNKILHKIVKFNLLNADVITSDSLYMSAKIAELLAPEHKVIKTLNFGMQQLPIKQDLAIKEKFILSCRLHKPLYQIEYIIKAFASLCNNQLVNSEYILLVAAAGELTPQLKQLADNLGVSQRVRFTGMLNYNELTEYYRKSSIFVSIPTSDGTSSSLLEAMGYGCVPVLSNLPANLEWVLNEINGFIVPDVLILADELLKAIQLVANQVNYQRLYDFNYDVIQSKADFNTNMTKFIELYD